MKEFRKYLDSVEPTLEEIGDDFYEMSARPAPDYTTEPSSNGDLGNILLKGQRVTRLRRERTASKTLGEENHREPQRKPQIDTVKGRDLPTRIGVRRVFAGQRALQDIRSEFEEPVYPLFNGGVGQTETAQPTNGELGGIVLYEGPATEPLGEHFPPELKRNN